MPVADRFRPLNMSSPEALGQCIKCGATMTIDLVDAITGPMLIHKHPDDPRYQLNPCGGRIRLFQEVRNA